MRRRRTILPVAVACVALIASGCTLDRGSGAASGTDSEVPSLSQDSTWADGLEVAANGPVPRIVVDQFGYRPAAQKVAVLRSPVTGYDAGPVFTPGDRVEVVDVATGAVVLSGPPEAWNGGAVDPASGDRAWWFDLSQVTGPGRYVVRDAASGLRSPQFAIADDVYEPVLRAALRTFFYQRAGQDKPAELAGAPWADGASHLGQHQDGEARSWLARDDPSTERDLRGGWYDAGDYNRYTAWHAGYLLALLHVYAEHPELVGDDTGIPESGNGVSDLLDEVVWGLDWLVRMQQDDGSVLCVQGVAHASPPSASDGPSYYGPPTTYATLRSASALAYAATLLGDSSVPELAARAERLTTQAEAAWRWAGANPAVTYFNNDEARQPGSGGLAAGQQETDDRGRARARLEAAVYLYGLTGDPALREQVEFGYEEYLPAGSPTQWTVLEQDTLLHFASLPGVTELVADGIRDDYIAALRDGPEFLPAVSGRTDPYRAPIAQYTWGSNQSKAAVGRMFAMAEAYDLDDPVVGPASRAAEDYLHYLHGVNPLGLVYLTSMSGAGAEHSASTLYHTWFSEGTPWDSATGDAPGPAPGFLVGGPNPAYSVDGCCFDEPACGGSDTTGACADPPFPPLDQPPMKAYRQFNDGWPANSWEVTENSSGYQVAYLRLLAFFTPSAADGGGTPVPGRAR